MTDICHWISLKSFPRPVTSSGWSPWPGWMVGRGWLPSLPEFVHPWLIHYSFVQFITGRHRGTGQQRANFDLHRRKREREKNEKKTSPANVKQRRRSTLRIFRRVCLENEFRRSVCTREVESNGKAVCAYIHVYVVARIESSPNLNVKEKRSLPRGPIISTFIKKSITHENNFHTLEKHRTHVSAVLSFQVSDLNMLQFVVT